MTPKIISTFGKKSLSPSGPPTSANALNAKVAKIAPSLLIIMEENFSEYDQEFCFDL